MLQRNNTDHTLVAQIDPVTVVEPGERLEHEHLVAGLTPVDVDEPAAPADAAPADTAVDTTPAAEEAAQ